MRVRQGRPLLAVVLMIGLLLVGCGPGPSGEAGRPAAETVDPRPTSAPAGSDPAGSDPGPDDPATEAPPTGEASLDPDDGGADGPALSLPRLPVGGVGVFVDEATQDLQCASISWTASGGPAGLDHDVPVEVVGYRLDTDHFSAPADGCPEPACDHYVFGSLAEATGCSIGIRTVRPQPVGEPDATLVVVGRARCEAVGTDVCQQFVDAVAQAADDNSLIDLAVPDPATPATPAEPSGASPSPSVTESPWSPSPSPTA